MRIGELAERTGVSRRSLRHYEQRGLLHAHRAENGWRTYDDAAVERVRAIAAMIRDGLTVQGVADVLPCLDLPPGASCDDPERTLRTYDARLDVLEHRLADVRRDRDRLAARVDELRTGGSREVA